MSFIKKALSGKGSTKNRGSGGDQGYPAGANPSMASGYGQGSYKGQTFLHGHLDLEIRAARNLPDMEGWVSKLYDSKDVTDPFVDVKLGKAKLAKTRYHSTIHLAQQTYKITIFFQFLVSS